MKQLIYIFNDTIERPLEDGFEIERIRGVFYPSAADTLDRCSQIRRIEFIKSWSQSSSGVINNVETREVCIVNRTTGAQKKFFSKEELDEWKRALTMEELLVSTIYISLSSTFGEVRRECFLEQQEMLEPTEKRKGKFYHMEIRERHTGDLIKEADYSGYKSCSNRFKEFMQSQGYNLDGYLFLLNGVDVTAYYGSAGGEMTYGRECYDEAYFVMTIKK